MTRTSGGIGGVSAAALRAIGLTVPSVSTRKLGLVAGGARTNSQVSGSNTRAISFVTYRATAPITRPRILHHNWRVPHAGFLETDGNAPMTCTDWLEYPIGQFLSPSVTGVCPVGQELVNDIGPLNISRGATFRVWSLRDGPLALFANLRTAGTGTEIRPAAIGAMIFFGAGAAGPTGPGQTIANPTGSFGYFPAVLDDTNYRSVGLYGDSHEYGTGDTLGLSGFYGPFERFYNDQVPWLNVGTPGDSLAAVLGANNFTRRARLAQYCTDIDIGWGGNDVAAGRTAAQIIADIQAVRSRLPDGNRYFTATEFPKTTSTDSFATTANQSVTAQEGARLAVNQFKRSGGAPFDYYLDFEKAVAATGTNGIDIVWQPGTTGDGTHLLAVGAAAVGALGTPKLA